ncbi:MAG TPA: 6,7-dimethyl-8-ribityllumazine synthase [Candidatus Limnocylindria bacterium]
MPKRAAAQGPRPSRAARVAVVTARWNEEITKKLASAAVATAQGAGASVDSFTVAGSFELPAAVAALADTGRYDAVVPIGCLIRGETPHFEVLANAVAYGLMELSLTYPAAIPFGVLTCDTVAQAKARAGGREGNKGSEWMDAALGMVALRQSLSSQRRTARTASRAAARSTS